MLVLSLLCLNPYFIGPCSPSIVFFGVQANTKRVLILILLDHALRVKIGKIEVEHHYVLILILLDHALRVIKVRQMPQTNSVLILILLDHALRAAVAAMLDVIL